jgi:hypothetical protein
MRRKNDCLKGAYIFRNVNIFMKYSKKQIKNSIRYWSRKLNEIEAFELVEAALNDFSNGKLLTESEKG